MIIIIIIMITIIIIIIIVIINKHFVVTQAAQARDEKKIIYVNETHANVTLAFERCCVTKMRFTRVCMGT